MEGDVKSHKCVKCSASNEGYPKVRNQGEGPFSWLKAAITGFTLKTLLRHYAKPIIMTQKS